ncbi:MAG TPA: NAD(P)/FAD-dependent oxidoreductase, partial [Thermoanaerobaculia bacterium]|nr:NAD(P)/FAD-dependent oxidoreductase [Thermoanaerobaculia bacterium]
GKPRNAPSPASHSYFTRDGSPSSELLRIGREQLRPYGVEVLDAEVVDAFQDGEAFTVVLGDGSRRSARRLLLATGVVDPLPEIEGLREMWGTSVLHCAYCHGWEVRDRPLAVYANGGSAAEIVALVRCLSRDVVLCTDGPADLGDHREVLDRAGIPIREEPVVRLEGKEGHLERIVFASSPDLPRHALFLPTLPRQHSDLAERLGCELTVYGLVKVDAAGLTTVPGVYAAGDLALRRHQVVVASADGAIAGITINHELAWEDLVRGGTP